MAKLEFNHEVLQVDVTDRLNAALSAFNTNLDLLNGIVLSSDFKDSNTFLTIKEELENDKVIIQGIISAIEEANKDLDTILLNSEQRLSYLAQSTLKKRSNKL